MENVTAVYGDTTVGARNGGTLMEIEKLIARLKCPAIQSCPIDGIQPSCNACQKNVVTEAISALEHLQAENGRLKRERDAAVEEIPKVCYYCKHRKGWKTCDKYNGNPEAETCESWKWRGWEAE